MKEITLKIPKNKWEGEEPLPWKMCGDVITQNNEKRSAITENTISRSLPYTGTNYSRLTNNNDVSEE